MKTLKQALLEKAKSAKRESKYIEFKETFDVDVAQDWCEIIKDIVAIANSGGGIILVGVKNDGKASGFDITKLLRIDSATISDKVSKYTSTTFQDFEIEIFKKGRKDIYALIIYESRIPMPFTKPGTYASGDGKQKSAFTQGTIYFRHGAKSETCNSEDLKNVIERNLEQIKKSWLGNIKKVVTAPTGSQVKVLPSSVVMSTSSAATPIRISNDSTAPVYQIVDPNKTHPFRQKEIIKIIHEQTGERLNSFHIRCIKQEFEINESRPDFVYKPKFASYQYSQLFANWLVEQYKADTSFFKKIREKYLKK